MTMYNIHRGSFKISQKGWIFMLLACLAGIGKGYGWVEGRELGRHMQERAA